MAGPGGPARTRAEKKESTVTTATVFVELLDEGVPVWRPTETEVLGNAIATAEGTDVAPYKRTRRKFSR